MDDNSQQDICRVCRSEGTPDRPLYHPCICMGSIKFIHQECLVQWLKYSRKEYCELCNHRFSFTPIYAPDMPKRLPIKDIVSGLLNSIGTAVRYWFHYTLVAFAWLGVVPISSYRIYRCLFSGSMSSVLTLPLDLLSTENLLPDSFHGCFVVTCTLCAFISLVWLREQILHGGGPEWLEQNPGENDGIDGGGQGGAEGDVGVGAAEPADGIDVGVGVGGDLGGAGDDPVNVAEPNNGAQDDNWNPIEWERAAEELTWERLLGLDGSLVFLEHVFWVVSLNTLFILVFAFCPYHIGNFTVIGLKLTDYVSNVSATQFDGLLTTLCGYIVIGTCLVLLHGLASLIRLRRSKRILGLCYVVIKVSLLSVVEIGLFPLVCGWWLDICSLAIFDATLKDRDASFRLAPGTSMFIHWLVGMVYVFYFASFILLLREVLRPGVLWFLRNLNDPDFSPIQEMIHLPIVRHVRRFLASLVIFGTTVLIMLWIPVGIIRRYWPGFLPYNVILSSETPVSELSLELLLLQVILPALMEQGHTRVWLRWMVRTWCVAVSWILDLRSYLLGTDPSSTAPTPSAAAAAAAAANENNNPVQVEPHAMENRANHMQEAAAGGPAQAPILVPPPRLLDPNVAHLDAINEEDGDVDDVDDDDGPEYDPFGVYEELPQVQEMPQPVADEVAAAAAVPDPVPVPVQVNINGGGGFQPAVLGAAHQALLQVGAPPGFQPYKIPTFFTLRIICLLVIMCFSLMVVSLITLTLPVFVGRKLMGLWMGNTQIHELYTAACGLYASWLVVRLVTVLYSWVPQGWNAIVNKLKNWAVMVSVTGLLTLKACKTLVAMLILVGVIPLLLGLLFELVIVVPLRVPLTQSPVFFMWQDWALGVLHTKIICAVTMMGPNWWLKQVIEQVYQDGVRNMNLRFIFKNLALPVIVALGLALSIPYVIACSVVPLFGVSFSTKNLVLRRIYPALLAIICLVGLGIFQVRQFWRLYEHIKNDKYLVGRRLVNYDHKAKASSHTQDNNRSTPVL